MPKVKGEKKINIFVILNQTADVQITFKHQ